MVLDSSRTSRKPKQETIPFMDRPLSYRIGVAADIERANGEYRRGFLEGQKHIMQELARLVETYLAKHDVAAHRSDLGVCRQKVDIFFPYFRDQKDTHQVRS